MIKDIQMSKPRGIYRQVITHERYRSDTQEGEDPILPDIIAPQEVCLISSLSKRISFSIIF